jgi:protein TonB
MKPFLTIFAIVCTGIAWSQEPVPAPTPPPAPKPEILKYVDEPAEFPGGMADLKKFIEDNLVYPETAKANEIKGRCYLQFIVSKEGNISNVKVVRGVADCPECDKEAVRVVKLMPKWIPGKVNGEPVHSTFNLPVRFGAPQ